MRHWRTQSSAKACLPPLFLWKREKKRKEGPFHYHPTCRLMPHSSSQPTVAMAATCHVICVSPCINVDVWDRRPPARNMHKGPREVRQSRRQLGTHPRQPALLFVVPGMIKNTGLTVTSGTRTSAAAAAAWWATCLLTLPSRKPFCVWEKTNLQPDSLSI